MCGDSSVAELPLFQGENGGAIPTSPLPFPSGWRVERCMRADISSFILRWHYSGSINGCTTNFCYRLLDSGGQLAGALFYGFMAMAGQWKRFADSPDKVIELRRLCCIDDTPKNCESFFVSKTLKMMRRDWRPDGIIVSYSDLEYGHTGTIYRASNFKCLGARKGARVIWWNNKKYHDKAIRTKYKGVPKPFAVRLRNAIERGEATYSTTKGKITFIYDLSR